MTLPQSLHGRLIVLVLGIVGGVWLAAAALTWWDAAHELDELLDSHLAQAAALLVAQEVVAPDDDGLADAPTLHHYAPRVAFQVWHGATLILRSANAPLGPMTARTAGFETRDMEGESWRMFVAQGEQPDVRVVVGEKIDARHEILWAVMRGLVGPVVVALPLMALLGWWAVRQGLRPLHEMERTIASRTPDALQPVELPDLPAELQALVGTLNALFGRIASLLDNERRFTADAAHELRTPIAAIRMQAQVAIAATEDPVRSHALAATLEGCDRAARLVEQLLMLSRLDVQAIQPGAARDAHASTSGGEAIVDLAAVARDVVARLAPAALARGQSVELDADDHFAVHGDETLLRVLLRNLVDNAIRYSPDGARVRIAFQRDGPRWSLKVDDSGPGLDEAQRARLGERFFRVLGTEASGSGLGWSIVRRIAEAQSLQVEASRSAALGGLQVMVSGTA